MEPSQANRSNRVVMKSTLKNNLQHWTALIVDDQADNLVVASVTLRHQGAQVYAVGSAEEGLALLKTIHPTFVLLDLAMPEIDGWAMHRQIREDPKFANLPIIALTAHAMDGDEDRVMAAGFDGYISKPFDITNLAVRIQHILDTIAQRSK